MTGRQQPERIRQMPEGLRLADRVVVAFPRPPRPESRQRRRAGICMVLCVLAACDSTPTEPPALPTTVTIEPVAAALSAIGETIQFRAVVKDQEGQLMAGVAATWASSDPVVATVSAGGLVTAVSNGSVRVMASAGTAHGNADVTVEQMVAAVEVVPAFDTLFAVGDTVRLSAEATDANGNPVSDVELAWATDDASVATVDSAGLVTAVGNGATEAVVTAGAVSGRALITVEQALASLAVSPAITTLSALGDTVRLVAVATDANGNVIADVQLAWTADDESVARVDSAGLVKGVGNGATEVVVTAGEVAASAAVSVRQIPSSIAVSPATATLSALGDTVRLVAVATDANGNPIADLELAWAVDDASVVRVDSAGLVKAVGNGATEVVVTAGELAASAAVHVRQTPSSIAVSPATGAVWVGRDDLQLAATVFDANGHVLTNSPPVRWSSSDTAVARAERKRGAVTGVGKGTATITAMSQNAVGTATITVRIPRSGPYPINVTYLGDVPEVIRQEMDRAATAWGRWLAPTLSAPYVLTEDVWLEVRSDLGSNGLLHHEAGDTLAPGLNVWVTTRTGGAWGWAWNSFPYLGTVRSDVPTAPWAVITFNWKAIRELPDADALRVAYHTALHEIGHAVGIGTSLRWYRHFETLDSTKPWDSFFTDPVTIAVFDKMGGADFPSKKIPLAHDGRHWDGCAGHFDLMGSARNETSTITELTLAAMAEGYEYDPRLAPRRRLDRNIWNSDSCKNGRWQGPSDQAAGYRVRGFWGDVIRDSGRGRL